MNPLLHQLQTMIRTEGPISLSIYMGLALGHPEHGYYHSRNPIGAAGDFITAPEISQMFGELIGLWCVQCWRDMGAPREFILCELGPGRGTLMADALRAARIAPDFLSAARLHFVETSPVLRESQQAALKQPVIWHDGVADLPPLPALIIANEFFDALPIRQFQRNQGSWYERMITLDPQTEQLCFVLSPAPLPDDGVLPKAVRSAPDGAIAEICLAARGVAAHLAAHLVEHGGAALIIDYGPSASAPGDSFQAVSGHKHVNPLCDPGAADLTAHVDFQALADAARVAGCHVDGPIAQGRFLLALGMAQRAARLAQNAPADEQAMLKSAVHRLTAPDQMGDLFKVMALRHPALAPSPGFEG